MRGSWKIIFALVLLYGLANVFASFFAYGQSALYQSERYWHWTPDAPHHAAAVKIQQGPYGGSGTLISHAGYYFIATADHVVENGQTAKATWPSSGYTAQCRVYARDKHADLAALTVQPPSGAVAVPLATSVPPLGTYCEITGFGGPIAPLRHWYARVSNKALNYGITLKSTVISGDSGGGILCQGRLVGVVSGGPHRGHSIRAKRGGSWSLVHPASGGNCVQLARILPAAQPPIYQPQQIQGGY